MYQPVQEEYLSGEEADVPEDDDAEELAANEEAEEEEYPEADEQEELGQIQRLFPIMDSKSSSQLNLDDLMNFFTEVSKAMAKSATPEIMVSYDKDNDNMINLQEFLENQLNLTEDGQAIEIEVFNAADKNGDTLIDIHEAPSAFFNEIDEDVTNIYVKKEMKERDLDKDGKVTPKEFWHGHLITGGLEGHDEELNDDHHEQFNLVDSNKDGFVDHAEYAAHHSGRKTVENAMKELIEVADSNKDNHITNEEVASAYNQIREIDAFGHLLEWASQHEL